MIQESQFKSIIPDVNWIYASKYIGLFDKVLPAYDINTPLRQAQFLAQITQESGGFKYTIENLNYSANALYAVFRKYFPTLAAAQAYARQPEKIANKVYANRLGNGNEASGDGYKYRGRGLIQLTGKDNYASFGSSAKIDAVNNPAQVATPQYALASACWFWKSRNINKYADQDDVVMVTKMINGGTNGLASREQYLEEYKKLLGVS
ncbi:MAG: glycoside hydrolase family 19 protein [Gilvibacter sp.]